ncbi:phospholipase D family protein [Diaphorobacter sp. HDW4A]|uniref:phospholipase D family protein n=1 Tax=Diaphorobacter sp. HDW4A TaxID=2714924 RepID=UPI00140B8D67|nr:phospholipase D family protein [Diaphorobacter sp. HDW4A]QIL78766.1 phospholipase D family protein [Diaphorobacter sp. HDW4A]
MLALVALLLTGCATNKLPTHVDRPISHAAAPAGNLPLTQITQSRKQMENKAGATASGFMLLTGPQTAYGSRLALIETARQSLDLQYYAIHADASTKRLMLAVVQAARRGVRVRILLDDFHGTGRNALVMRMAFVPNVQMRMFNPLAGDRENPVSRMWHAATDFQRAQQRMHNKLFLADNVMGVMGGRNLGDSYFGNAESNFIDADVLIAGPLVQDLSRSFDEYWNNERAYPVQSLIEKKELDRMRAEFTKRDTQSEANGGEKAANAEPQGNASSSDIPRTSGTARPQPPDGEPRPSAKDGLSKAQRSQVWDMAALDLKKAPLIWANAIMLADKPGKIPAVDAEGKTDPMTAQTSTTTSSLSATKLRGTATQDMPSSAAQPSPASQAESDDSVVDGLISLINYVQKDLLVVSPYFVPGERMMAVFKAAVDRGVRVRILTNSLASNDAPVAHIGYARYREQLLKNGVELYELVSDPSNLRAAFGMGSTGSATPHAQRVMLHSKVLVLDGKLTVIGSMNLDQRSKLQNTEIAVLVRSNRLSAETTRLIEPALALGSWHVVLENGSLVWKPPQNSDLREENADPDTSLPLRMMLKIIAPMVPDSVL